MIKIFEDDEPAWRILTHVLEHGVAGIAGGRMSTRNKLNEVMHAVGALRQPAAVRLAHLSQRRRQRQQARAEDGTIAGMLTDQLYFGRNMQFTADLDANYAALTRDQVNAAIRKHLKPDALSVFVAGDFAKAAGAPVAAPKK